MRNAKCGFRNVIKGKAQGGCNNGFRNFNLRWLLQAADSLILMQKKHPVKGDTHNDGSQ